VKHAKRAAATTPRLADERDAVRWILCIDSVVDQTVERHRRHCGPRHKMQQQHAPGQCPVNGEPATALPIPNNHLTSRTRRQRSRRRPSQKRRQDSRKRQTQKSYAKRESILTKSPPHLLRQDSFGQTKKCSCTRHRFPFACNVRLLHRKSVSSPHRCCPKSAPPKIDQDPPTESRREYQPGIAGNITAPAVGES